MQLISLDFVYIAQFLLVCFYRFVNKSFYTQFFLEMIAQITSLCASYLMISTPAPEVIWASYNNM